MRMVLLNVFHLMFIVICLQVLFQIADSKRTFEIDWAHDRLLKDGVAFRFISGSFDYFRAHPHTWQRKLRTMRAGGLNTVATYVEWSLHNPKDGVYVWNGIANLERFIRNAMDEDLLVILRPGPYICAERDFGGFPYWLLTKYPEIQLRTADINYLFEVRVWYAQLMSKVVPYLYGSGGPVIMIQVENEYGSFYACDKKYRSWLRNEILAHVKDNAVLFTTDGPGVLDCGYIDGVLATIDFGFTNIVRNYWIELRSIQPKGPLINAEYYSGWLTHWSQNLAELPVSSMKQTLINMLDDGASVNIHMYYGGTNFGLTTGANYIGPGNYQPDITSYDYDAPMTEAGDPTNKYFALRDIIARYLPLPNISIPVPLPKKNYGTIKLQQCCTLLSAEARKRLSTGVVIAEKPKTFEALNQYSGLVLYETFLPATKHDPAVLHVPGLHDRAYVYVDDGFVGILSREIPVYDLPISISAGNKLQIFVENQGRINYGPFTDFKGITEYVTFDNKVLKNWNMTKYPLESYDEIETLIEKEGSTLNEIDSVKMLQHGPTIFYGSFNIIDSKTYDTYVDTTGWSKGILYVNGENVGRYWPVVGPQITLYVPAEVLRVGVNNIVLIEYQRGSLTSEIFLTDRPNLRGIQNKSIYL